MSKKTYISKHRLFLAFLFITSFLAAILAVNTYNKGNESTVVLGDEGFLVQALTIKKGGIVTWKIAGKNAHWPASDFHPTHGEYPEGGGCIGSRLDACRGFKAGEKYSFKFNRIGEWKMHDHFFHSNTMIIKVVENKNTSILSSLAEIFENINIEILTPKISSGLSVSDTADSLQRKCAKDQQCMMPEISEITKKRGHEFAFALVTELKKTDDNIASNCHRLAHGIGWATYETDPENWKENVRKIDTDCNWGGLHGIVEQYVAKHKVLDEETVKTLCAGDGACMHGIGHMLLVQTGNDIPKAARICTVLTVKMERHMCMTGIFMERMTLQNLLPKEEDSGQRRMEYWKDRLPEFEKLCEGFRGDEHSACWEEIARPAAANFSSNPEKALQVCDGASTAEGAYYCRRRVVSELITRKKFDMSGMKYICGKTPANDVTFMRDCYLRIAHLAYISLPEGRRGEIKTYCKTIPQQYIKACDDLSRGSTLNESISQNIL